jgi:ATP-dependent helicase HrpB
LDPLPIDDHLRVIAGALAEHRAAVLVAEPGAGKTTRVPPALVARGAVLLLQPRRAAARSIAQRIAGERGWSIGREVGWQTRFDRRFSADTQLLVATEGILTARAQQDPLLSIFSTIVLDEFHERSIHADLGLALTKEAWRARPDLHVLVMSATIDTDHVARYLDGCPVVRIAGRTHPVAIRYAPLQPASGVAIELSRQARGDVLCFLPGAREIEQTRAEIAARVSDVDVLPLHGALDAVRQDEVLAPASSRSSPNKRRIVVATNLAETSVTVPGVTAVVDTGLHKVARYDPARAIDSLTTERITADAADQRAGRAGRLGPGQVVRLWAAHDRLRPHRQPEVHRVDLSGPVLDILAWGGNPRILEWFDPPRDEAIEAALGLLERLGAVNVGRLTAIGRQMQSMPLPPRIARILIAGRGSPTVARACAILSERLPLPPRTEATTSDLLSALDDWRLLPSHVHQVASEIEQRARALRSPEPARLTDEDLQRALLSGYPDRVAQRRGPRSARVKLASGAGGVVSRESGVQDGEFLIALDVRASSRADAADHRVRLASLVDRSWLTPTSRETLHRIDEAGTVRAVRIERYDALVLSETPTDLDGEVAAALLAEAWLDRPRSPDELRLLRRLAFAGNTVDLAKLAARAASGARSVSAIHLEHALAPEVAAALARNAPDALTVPSGRAVRLDYHDDGSVGAAVKLQELFGLAETPRIGPKREPVVFSLLAPSGRPVQVTRDLRSFWDRTYPEVRKELRARYPRHPWPEDPWNAPPTARAKRRL